MTTILTFMASVVELFAYLGAGAVSTIAGYEPEIPSELK